ncbi:hypothetical protein GGX14DRAFT_310039, partial [Mycena pura]
MHQHSLAHPLIPGYCAPTATAIHYWAVKQIYEFCVEHAYPGLFAYLWENWYRSGRWELWARSAHPTIPRLRTTMICESHWRLIKHDYLPHFHSPRLDLLAYVLVQKLTPHYYEKFTDFVTISNRSRLEDLPCWRKPFKKLWRDL